ncbi:GntR family transcriptional regulator [bacterium]|uniref:GntR family transcriptional regulator n=1 Tax=Gemmiger sp. TaxID=2049027 RepID=UPI002A7EFD26|nr:GntR family transcriptional regulator [Gemmiger sp.]MCI5556693.1 GntR family transcriptional regulator [bacterium]MCI6177115.1 GntR family transcriptional regulator [bacterium]MCI6247882.1 GntR family transcriptional regulator [bacterium]MCI6521811.1 GntR family transcriptional regulator [bacterium]MCI6884989.1 GntR family transcriptional regulator [bacterium]
MELYISNAGQEPIYAQITRQIQEKILSGELREGDALPSIRALARDLRISVITTKRAYEDLEAAGFITTMPGRGSFVAPQNPALHREQALTQVEEALSQAIAAARRGGVNLEEVTETLNLLWEE